MSNTKNTKRALLTSVVAMILCLTMLIGTTFAWFTDSASTNVNSVTSGTLTVELQDATGAKVTNLSWQKAAGAEGETVLWEPGCTYKLQPVTIKNTGSLALKYKIDITGITGNNELKDAIDWTIQIGGENVDLAAYEGHLTAGETAELTISGTMKTSAGNEYQGKSIENVQITVSATQYTYEHDSNDDQYDKNAQ